MSDITIIERRRIEATMLKHVFDVLKERYGEAEARAVIEKSVIDSAIDFGKSFADKLDHTPTFHDYVKIMPLWSQGGACEFEGLAATDDTMSFDVVRCRYAEMYHEMGLAEIGYLLSCNRDGAFCIGYNPNMELKRSKTIMEGSSCCEFRYSYKSDGSSHNDDPSLRKVP